MFRKTMLVAAAVLALLGVGCGSSDGGGDTQSPTISKAEFVKRANDVCVKTVRHLIEATKPILATPEGSRARLRLEFKLVQSVVGPGFENEIAEIEALGAPAGDEAKIERFLSLMEPVVEETKAEPETFVHGGDYHGGAEHYGEAEKLADEYGFSDCPVQ